MRKGGEFERVFLYFDENGDGKVSPTELKKRLSLMGKELPLKEVEMAMESLDKDGDGLLDLNDLVELVNGGDEEQKLQDIREAFEMYVDDDKCGFITPKSLKRMLSKLGDRKSVDECKVMISQFDLNGDGVISFDEFRIMMMQ